jgi:hypothetical protein
MSVDDPIGGSPSFEIWLERRPHLRPGPVQEHPSISLLNAEDVTHLLRGVGAANLLRVRSIYSFTGVKMGAPLAFSSTTTNLAGSVVLALRPTT